MTDMLHALMDSTDHLMEDGTLQELYKLVDITASPGKTRTLVVSQIWRCQRLQSSDRRKYLPPGFSARTDSTPCWRRGVLDGKRRRPRGKGRDALSKPRTEFPMIPRGRFSFPGDAWYVLQHSVWLRPRESPRPTMTEWSRQPCDRS